MGSTGVLWGPQVPLRRHLKYELSLWLQAYRNYAVLVETSPRCALDSTQFYENMGWSQLVSQSCDVVISLVIVHVARKRIKTHEKYTCLWAGLN